MSPEAKAWNEAHDNIQMEYYDREIARLEPLAQKELEDEITANILKNIEKGISVDASKIGKEIQKALKGLKLWIRQLMRRHERDGGIIMNLGE